MLCAKRHVAFVQIIQFKKLESLAESGDNHCNTTGIIQGYSELTLMVIWQKSCDNSMVFKCVLLLPVNIYLAQVMILLDIHSAQVEVLLTLS